MGAAGHAVPADLVDDALHRRLIETIAVDRGERLPVVTAHHFQTRSVRARHDSGDGQTQDLPDDLAVLVDHVDPRLP